jgi:hypothetical protein
MVGINAPDAGADADASTSHAGKPWSDADDARLRSELRGGNAPAQIARALGRTAEELFLRLAVLADTHERAAGTAPEMGRGSARATRR